MVVAREARDGTNLWPDVSMIQGLRIMSTGSRPSRLEAQFLMFMGHDSDSSMSGIGSIGLTFDDDRLRSRRTFAFALVYDMYLDLTILMRFHTE